METTRPYGETRRLICQNGWKNLDESVPAHSDAPANSSREWASEPRRREVSGKHIIDIHFAKDRNCDTMQKNLGNKGSLQKTHRHSRTSSRKCWCLDNSRSQSSVKDVNLETIIDLLSSYQIWQLSGYNQSGTQD